MLILTRKIGESIYLFHKGVKIKISLLRPIINGHNSTIGIDAPQEVRIMREELVCDVDGEATHA